MPQQAIQELKTRAREQAAGRETPVNRLLTAYGHAGVSLNFGRETPVNRPLAA